MMTRRVETRMRPGIMQSLARPAMAAALLALAACTPRATPLPGPAPASPAAPAPPAEAAPISPSMRSVERAAPDPRAVVACATTGRIRLDADSVSLRFTAAFLKVGILPIRLSLPSVDGVSAGPVEITEPAAARVSARAVTEMRSDSTVYRVEVRVGPVAERWAAGDSTIASAHAGALCTRVVELAFP